MYWGKNHPAPQGFEEGRSISQSSNMCLAVINQIYWPDLVLLVYIFPLYTICKLPVAFLK